MKFFVTALLGVFLAFSCLQAQDAPGPEASGKTEFKPKIELTDATAKGVYNIEIENPGRFSLNMSIFNDSGSQIWTWDADKDSDGVTKEVDLSKKIKSGSTYKLVVRWDGGIRVKRFEVE